MTADHPTSDLLSDEELHDEMWSTLCKLNLQILLLAERGCDVNVRVKGIDPDLYRPRTKPEIVIRVTKLVGFTNTKPEGELVQFKPRVIS